MGNFDIDVIIRILSYLAERPMRKTELWRLSRLNYPRFQEYLNLLLEKGLVVERDGYYMLSERGVRETAMILDWLKRLFY